MTRSDRTPLNHAYLIKGWLLGREVPPEVSEALEAIIADLSAPPLPSISAMVRGRMPTPDGTSLNVASVYLNDTPVSLDASGSVTTVPDLGAISFNLQERETLDHNEARLPQGPQVGDQSPTGEGTSTQKAKRAWSTEARAAAAERMRARQAAGLMKRPPAGGLTADGDEVDTPPTRPVATAAPHRLTVQHPDYAGRRDPGQGLTDEDWPDIKARLAKSPDRRGIAGDYDVEVEDLSFFIQSCQRRELRAGEALAPRHHGA